MFAALSNDLTLYYEDLGRSTPLLCLPPFPFDHTFYRGQYALEGSARLIFPDFRGTGRSQLTAGPYTMELLAADAFGLLDYLHIERATVLGTSLGGYVALAMQALHPERIAGLILADTRSEADSPEALAQRALTAASLRREGAGMLRERVLGMFSPVTRRSRPDWVEAVWLEVESQNVEGLAELTLGLGARPDRGGMLSALQTPTLVLCGEDDAITPPDSMSALAGRIPGAKCHTLPGAGHLAALEQPQEFNRLIREFLQVLDLRAAR